MGQASCYDALPDHAHLHAERGDQRGLCRLVVTHWQALITSNGFGAVLVTGSSHISPHLPVPMRLYKSNNNYGTLSADKDGITRMQMTQEEAIEVLLNTKTREAITDAINQYGDTIDWLNYSTREILEEVARSDREAGEVNDGILASIYEELV